ncbi:MULTISPECIES: GNAT family N-acetyltransferase [Streptomyces]|uniref:GNAT family N-acetyltransferase n=1 Tax=Streptomyces TaxID=1883 RepID=UPI0004C9159C|nr:MULTISPECIES: GNAT family N-acetyltransferase [Streptomyces]KOT55662.1 acetyltransferase [Streptomyces rimosus subsp. rimosus]
MHEPQAQPFPAPRPPSAAGFTLRVPSEEDALHWHRVFAHPDVMEFHGGAPAELSVYQELTARQRRHHAEHGFCMYSMIGTGAGGEEAGTVLGFTGAQPWPRDWGPVGEIEIGWRLGRAHWGKGYATQAARAALEAVRAAGVRSVVAMVASGNERSIAVTRRLGMRHAETFRTPSGQEGFCFRLEL